MVDHIAERVQTARTHARVLALLIVAGPVRRAVRVDDTLRVLTFGTVAHHPAYAVRTAR